MDIKQIELYQKILDQSSKYNTDLTNIELFSGPKKRVITSQLNNIIIERLISTSKIINALKELNVKINIIALDL